MGKVKLSVGDKAPHFKIESYNAGVIDLEDFIGKQKIVLIFSRYFGCPICQLDFKELSDRSSEIEEKGAKLLYITQSSKEKAQDFIQAHEIGFPVIPSSKDELYKEYGLGMMTLGAISKVPGRLKAAKKANVEHGEYEGWEKQSPGQFIIGTDGKILHARKGWLNLDLLLKDL